MTNQRLLIVDDDPASLKMVSFVLEKYGYTIDTASDGAKAMDCVERNTPDLIITDVSMPRMDGWALIRILRARPETAFTPVIFLTAATSEEDRMMGFRLGADDYLSKPFHLEELKLRVRNVLRRASAAEARQRTNEAITPSSGVRGSLKDFGMSSLLVLMEMEKKSGILTIDRGDMKAKLHVRGGRLVTAEIEGLQEPRGTAVVYGVLTWPDGKFEFAPGEVTAPDVIHASTTHLLMESARIADERNRGGR